MKKIRTIFLGIISLGITFYLLGFMIFTLIRDNKNTENSKKLEVSDMIYGDIIQEPQVVEAPEEDVRFPDSNPIYGGIGTHEIVGDKTIYYNDEYGISFRLWEEFSGGNIVERDTEEWDTINENLYKLHRIEVYKKDGGGEGYGQVFIINAVNNEQFNIWKGHPVYNENLENDVLGTNNKYSFWSTNLKNGIVDITNERVTDMYIFDVNSPEVISGNGEQNILIEEPVVEEKNYDENSWKELISQDCKHFFDGCNHCKRIVDGELVCSDLTCEEYGKPECTDFILEDMQ